MGRKAVARQYYATISSQMSMLMTAVSFVWFTPITMRLMDPSTSEIYLTSSDMGWLIAFIEIGELFGPLPGAFIADKCGRKMSLLSTFPLMVASWIVTALTRSQLGLYCARFLQGIATGIGYAVCPVYVAEIAEPSIRGELSGHLQTTWFIGVVYTYAIGPFVSYSNYIYLSSLPVFLFLFTFAFSPESPYYLVMSEKRKEAEEALMWLRGDTDVSQELQQITDTVRGDMKQNNGGWEDLLFSVQCRKPLLMMIFMCAVKYFSGPCTITTYFSETFVRGGAAEYADYATIVMGLVLTISAFVAAYLSDSVGRKPLLIYSTLGIGLSSSFVCAYSYLEHMGTLDGSKYQWFLYAGIAVSCIAFNMGLAPVQTTLQAECFPSHVRAPAGALITLACNLFVFISIKQYQLMEDLIGVYSNYLLFALISFLSLFVFCPYLEETAKKSLGEIQSH